MRHCRRQVEAVTVHARALPILAARSHPTDGGDRQHRPAHPPVPHRRFDRAMDIRPLLDRQHRGRGSKPYGWPGHIKWQRKNDLISSHHDPQQRPAAKAGQQKTQRRRAARRQTGESRAQGSAARWSNTSGKASTGEWSVLSHTTRPDRSICQYCTTARRAARMAMTFATKARGTASMP